MTEESLFKQAIQIASPEERRRFVDQACADDQELRENVMALLEAHQSADPLLDAPRRLNETQILESELVGRTVGPYKLLEQIGEGGFGVVFLAEEAETINRRVALKIIKPGMDTKEVIARFEAERQALAMMEHDNIARVFGGGRTEDGLPYFVMELVKGVPITDYCDSKQLPPNERIELLISVCRAVQHAHQKGIIHRDLKPSNILVAEYDHRPVVKIIDFGVAKALNQRLTNRTVFTHYGSVVGTIQYMSPEQAKFNQLDVDTRSDVYSLGAILYELLTGNTPIARERLKSASLEEVIRWIREEEPSKPSTKIESEGRSAKLQQMGAVGAGRLSRLVRGDLDWIVMKSLEKDRDRRYDSATEFADDLQRHLDGQPVLASPPSLTYKTRKFVRRHRAALATVAAIAVLGAIALTALVRMRIDRIDRNRIAAESRLQQFLLEDARRETERIEQQRKREQELSRQTIPAIESAIEKQDYSGAFDLVSVAAKQFPEHQELAKLMTVVSSRWTVETDPPGATVSLRRYGQDDDIFQTYGITPLSIDVGKGYYHYRIAQDGHESIEGCAGPDTVSLKRALDANGSVPKGMVRVPASQAAGISSDFFIDRHEVTNRDFKRFLDRGGYEAGWLWDGVLGFGSAWQSRIAGFVDQTGKPGPHNWQNGNYPAGMGDLPVTGICWAEAVAYARLFEKSLPTIRHWNHACGHELTAAILPKSNIDGQGLVRVGKTGSVGPFGTLDMLGNASEWCFNSYGDHDRTIGGRSFRGPSYGTRAGTPLEATLREPFVGFRCVKYTETIDPTLYAGLARGTTVQFDGRQPISDREFEIIRRLYDYNEHKSLDERFEGTLTVGDVVRDTYSFNTAYNRRMLAHIFRPPGPIPKKPHLLINVFGVDAFQRNEFGNSNSYNIRQLVASGKIVVAPILQGMYERHAESSESHSQAFRNQVRDFRRCVDFLKKSPDFSSGRFIYMGWSWGGSKGPIFCALEPRIEAAIYVNGGVAARYDNPEFDAVNFAPRATQPALMINGVEDHVFPVESSQKPMFELLAAAKGMKEHRLLGLGHNVEQGLVAEHVDRWIWKRIGGVDRITTKSWRDTAAFHSAQGLAAAGRQEYADAEQHFRKQLSLLEEHGPPEAPADLVEAKLRVGLSMKSQGGQSIVESIEVFEETLDTAMSTLDGQHQLARITRNELCAALVILTRDTVMTSEDSIGDKAPQTQQYLDRIEQLKPKTAWPHLLRAVIAFRQDESDEAREHLRQCESLADPCLDELILRSIIASESTQTQEARDWLAVADIWRNGQPAASMALYNQALSLLDDSGANNASQQDQLDAIFARLIQAYPGHYLLYWLRGRHTIRQTQQIETAHRDFRSAFEICPDYGVTDWYAITSQWLGDREASSQCGTRLAAISNERLSGNAWQGVHIARTYLRDAEHSDIRPLRSAIDVASRTISDSDAFALVQGLMQYRRGEEVRIPAFVHPGNPEEQAVSMIYDAITEFQFGNRNTSYEKLDAAREFVKTTFPSPAGPRYKFVDADHGWCVSQLLLREASSLMELGGSKFDRQIVETVARLRAELYEAWGAANADEILYAVGETLVEQYNSGKAESVPE